MNPEKPDDLDRILSQKEIIVPSSGFAARVMELVEQEALAPPPIAFPWGRALPGLAVCLGLLGFLMVKAAAAVAQSARSAIAWPATGRLLSMMQPNFGGSGVTAVTVALVLALFLSLGIMWLSLRIAGVRQ